MRSFIIYTCLLTFLALFPTYVSQLLKNSTAQLQELKNTNESSKTVLCSQNLSPIRMTLFENQSFELEQVYYANLGTPIIEKLMSGEFVIYRNKIKLYPNKELITPYNIRRINIRKIFHFKITELAESLDFAVNSIDVGIELSREYCL